MRTFEVGKLLQIRGEIADDVDTIRDITEAAFRGRPYAGGDEMDVIDRLRGAGALSLSLVAVRRGELVGQVTFSPAQQADGSGDWYALGPVSVSPVCQGELIGTALIEAGLAQIKKFGARGCILTGDPDYYRRFGFEVAAEYCPDNEPGEYFQLKLLGDEGPGGKFTFHTAFYGAA